MEGNNSPKNSPRVNLSVKNMFNIDVSKLFQSMKTDEEVCPIYDSSKYRLKYHTIYENKEIENAFYEFLKTEFNTMPLDFLRDFDKFEQKKTGAEKSAHLKYICETYINVNSEKELNLSGKDRKVVLKEIQESGQLDNPEEWVIEKSPQDLLFIIKERMFGELGNDSFGRFILTDFWIKLIPKYIKNPLVMERLRIFDAELKNEKYELYKPKPLNQATARKLTFNPLTKKLTPEEERMLMDDAQLAGDYLSKGIEFFKRKENQQAFEAYTFAIELNPTLKEAYFNRGILNYNTKNLIESIEDMMKVIEFDPKNARALSCRAMCFKELGYFKAALRDFHEAEHYDTIPKNFMLSAICYDQLDMDKKANEYYDKFLKYEKNTRNSITALHNKSQNNFMNNKFDEAIEDLSLALKISENEENSEEIVKQIKFLRSRCYQSIGDLTNAKLDYEESSIVTTETLYEEAIEKFQENNFSEAHAIFSEVLEIETENEEVYYSRGLCSKYMDDSEGALKDFMRCIEIKPDFPKPYIHMARHFVKIGNVDKAKSLFKKCLDLVPTLDNYFERAIFYNSIEKNKEAIQDFSKCIELDPTFGDAYYNRGLIQIRMKLYQEALADLTEALKYETDPDIHVDRALCYYYLNDTELAKNELKHAISLDSNNQRAKSLLEKIST
jgi:tetratricopeptide (TPR) repeat protein